MLTLESFRLLNAKVGQLEKGTGGTPDITYQEVADVLSRVSKPCSMYSRYQYGLDDSMRLKLVDAITSGMFIEDQKRKRPVLPLRDHWMRVTDVAVRSQRLNRHLTRKQMAVAGDFRRWSRRLEEAYRNVGSVLNNWDYEIRAELRAWNLDQLDGTR